KEFMGGANQADDITFVLLQWKKTIEGKARQAQKVRAPKPLSTANFTQRVAVAEELTVESEPSAGSTEISVADSVPSIPIHSNGEPMMATEEVPVRAAAVTEHHDF